MYEFERERQRSQPGFRECGLRPLPPPVIRRARQAARRANTFRALLFLLGFFCTCIVITLALHYRTHLLPFTGDIMVGVVWLVVVIIGVRVVSKVRALRRDLQARPLPPARVHDAPLSRYSSTRYRSPDALPSYPPEHFFSYDPLNKRSSEHLNPDQRNRF